jgi:hypothetical protein
VSTADYQPRFQSPAAAHGRTPGDQGGAVSTHPGRRAIHGFVTTDAHEAWHCAGDQHGSVSAILQALADGGRLGLLLDGRLDPADQLGIAADARRLAATRRRRTAP